MVLLQPINEDSVCTEIHDLESGQSVRSCIKLPMLTDPQKVGSAITYFRRYSLQSLLALQTDDDDGNKASQPVKSDVLEISKKLENSSEMTQEEVDALVSELQNAINALEKAPTVTTDTNEPAHKPQVVTNNKVKTGDSTSVWTFATFALMAAIVYVSLRKRTKED